MSNELQKTLKKKGENGIKGLPIACELHLRDENINVDAYGRARSLHIPPSPFFKFEKKVLKNYKLIRRANNFNKKFNCDNCGHRAPSAFFAHSNFTSLLQNSLKTRLKRFSVHKRDLYEEKTG